VSPAGPVDAQHHVEGVHLPRELVVVVAGPRTAGDRHLESGGLPGSDDLAEVDEFPAVGTLEDHHPRPPTWGTVVAELDRPAAR